MLRDLTVLRAPQGTTFRVSPEQWRPLIGTRCAYGEAGSTAPEGDHVVPPKPSPSWSGGRGLEISDEVAAAIIAALNAGNHVISQPSAR